MRENHMVEGYGYEEGPEERVERDDPTDEDRNEWIKERDEPDVYVIPASLLFELRSSNRRMKDIVDEMLANKGMDDE